MKTAMWQQNYFQHYGLDPAVVQEFMNFQNLITMPAIQYKMPVILLGKETPKEAVCQVFENVNTGGVSLTVFELITAVFAMDDFELRKDWDGRKAKYFSGDLLSVITATDFLTACTLLSSYKRGGTVSCKKKDVLNLTLNDYKKYANDLAEGFVEAEKILQEERIFVSRDLPYTTQLIPMAVLCTLLADGNRIKITNIKTKIKQWYWCGVFGELYGSANETRYVNDVVGVLDWINNGGAVPKTVQEAYFNPTRLLTLQSRQSAAYKGIMALILKNHCKDFISGREMDFTLYRAENIDIHHIFPKDYCERQGYPRSKWNSVINKTPITYSTNREIGGAAPSIYLGKIASKGQVDPVVLDDYLETHWIDVVAAKGDDFNKFIASRASMLLDAISNATLAVNVAACNQIKVDTLSQLRIYGKLVSIVVGQNLVAEQIGIDHTGTVCNCFCQLALQPSCEGIVAFAGDNGQQIDVMDIVTQDIGIHAVAVLIDAETQTAADFLALTDFAAALLQSADLEHIGVVPTFSEGRVGEDEAYRGFLGIEVQKKFFLLHNERICVDIIGDSCLFVIALFGINKAFFFVHREVTGVGIVGIDGIQILLICFVTVGCLEVLQNVRVFLFEHIGINAVVGSSSVVELVFCNLIDEKQTQNLDTLGEKLTFPFHVGENCLPDLEAAQLLLIDLADDIAHEEFLTVEEFNAVVPSINALDCEAVVVLFQIAGVGVQIEAFTDGAGDTAQTFGTLEIKFDSGSGIGTGEIDALKIDVALRGRCAGLGDALHCDFLDQMLVVGFQCVQTVDHVVDAVGAMGSGVAQGHKGVEVPKLFFCFWSFHRLRLIDDEYGIGFLNNIDGFAETKGFLFAMDTVGSFATGIDESLVVDDHDIDRMVRSEAINISESIGIVDEVADASSVLRGEVILGDLEGFEYTFADGNTGNNYDEFTPAIMAV